MANVLSVDDEPVLHTTLTRFLKLAGHETFSAVDAAETEALIAERNIDVALVDIVLGKDSGLAVARSIRTAQPNTQIILITGHPAVGSAREAIHLHAFDYLVKPVKPEHITDVVNRAAEEKRRRDEYDRLQIEREQYRELLEQRIAERTAELAESEERYRSLAENTQDILCAIDQHGVLKYVGPQVRRYGFKPADIEGRSFMDFVFPDDRDFMAADFHRSLAEDKAFPSEFRVQAPDGALYWFEEWSTIRHNADGAITGFVGVLRDVTERKKAEKLRITQQERLRHLAAKLATAQDEEQRHIAEGLHDDVAQLITAIDLKLAVLHRCNDAGDAECLYKELEDLLRKAHVKVRDLSFELLTSTLYQLGLFEAIEELCHGMEERYGVHFAIEGEGQTSALDEATATVLFKAIRELLFNVVKHAGVKNATVSLHREDNMLRVAVEDHGTGFHQFPDEEDIGVSKGLGLFGIEERLRDLGGKMEIESEPQVRTRVTLWIPLGKPCQLLK